jgi:hypothetical protein
LPRTLVAGWRVLESEREPEPGAEPLAPDGGVAPPLTPPGWLARIFFIWSRWPRSVGGTSPANFFIAAPA